MEYFESINRTAVIISHKKALTDWLESIDPSAPLEIQKHDGKTIYLLPEEDDDASCERYLKKHWRKIFEQELEDWCTDMDQWPKVMSWEVFNEWFDYEFQSMIFDTLDGSIEKE